MWLPRIGLSTLPPRTHVRVYSVSARVAQAWFVRQFPTEPEKKILMALFGVPKPVIALVMIPAIRKYNATFTAPFAALIGGATEAPPAPPSTGCSCSVM